MSEAMCAPDNRTRFEKIRDKLFPYKPCPLPDAPVHFADCIHQEIDCYFNFADRLKILLSGRVKVLSKIVTENSAGQTIASAESFPRAKGQI